MDRYAFTLPVDMLGPRDGIGFAFAPEKAPPEQNLRRFGMSPIRIDPLEAIVGGTQYDPRIAYLTSVIASWAYADRRTTVLKVISTRRSSH